MSATLTDNYLKIYSDTSSTNNTASITTNSCHVSSLTCGTVTMNSSGYNNSGKFTINNNGFYSLHGSVSSNTGQNGYAYIPLTTNQTNTICLVFVTTSLKACSIYQFSWFYNLQNGTSGGNMAWFPNTQNGANMTGSPGSSWRLNVSTGQDNVTVNYNIVSLGGSTYGTSFGPHFNWTQT
jgi:hypothetical protein